MTTSQAVQAEWDSKIDAIQHLRAVDRVQNEGGEGFSSYEAAAEDLADEYLPRITALRNAEFAATWTRDVTVQRRATWNAEIGKLGTKIEPGKVSAVIARLGYSHVEIAKAKALHGMN